MAPSPPTNTCTGRRRRRARPGLSWRKGAKQERESGKQESREARRRFALTQMGNALAATARIEAEEKPLSPRPAKLENRESSDAEESHVVGMEEVAGCTSRVLLSISCPSNQLSTPACSLVVVVSLQHGKRNPQWQELGRTRVTAGAESYNNLNPHSYAPRKVSVVFHLESVQTLKFDVFTAAEGEGDGDRLDVFQGSMLCLLTDLCRAPGRTLTRPILQQPSHLTAPPSAMLLTVDAEEQRHQNSSLRVKLKGEHFKLSSFAQGGGSAFFLRIFRTHGNNPNRSASSTTTSSDSASAAFGPALRKVAVHTTEVVSLHKVHSPKDSPPPCWDSFEMNMGILCKGNVHRPIIVQVLERHERVGPPRLVGEIHTTANSLLKAGAPAALPIPGSGTPPAKLVLQSAQLIARPSFLDFLGGGCELSLLTAIDFTASNGDPEDPDSLHYLGPDRSSPYQAAITAITTVLGLYTNKRFPVFGFGAKPAGSGEHVPTSHGFACSGLMRQFEVDGLDGVLRSYEATLKRMTPAEPRRFAQVIAQASRLASEYHLSLEHKYYVLVLLTNGVSEDMDQVVSEIIRASSLPLSILIVGVGGGDFGPLKAALNISSGEGAGWGGSSSSSSTGRPLLRTARTIAARDMVRFVACQDLPRCSSAGVSSSSSRSAFDPEALAQALLQELPRQICSYFACHKIQPHPLRVLTVKERRSSSLASSLSSSSGVVGGL